MSGEPGAGKSRDGGLEVCVHGEADGRAVTGGGKTCSRQRLSG